jgi:hypothetical protein
MAVRLRLGGTDSAGVKLVARVRGRVVARTSAVLAGGDGRELRMPVTMAGRRILRAAPRAPVVLVVIASDPSGRSASAVSRVRPA